MDVWRPYAVWIMLGMLLAAVAGGGTPGPAQGVSPLGGVIEAVLQRRRGTLEARGISVEVDVAPALPLIASGPADLETLLLRLLAFSEARVREAPERQIRLTARPIGASVILTITDTGPPLPAGKKLRGSYCPLCIGACAWPLPWVRE